MVLEIKSKAISGGTGAASPAAGPVLDAALEALKEKVLVKDGVLFIGNDGSLVPYWEDEDTGVNRRAAMVIGTDDNDNPLFIFTTYGDVLASYIFISAFGGKFGMYADYEVHFDGSDKQEYYVSLADYNQKIRDIAVKAGYDIYGNN